MAPATTSNCGPALAIMPGIALPRKPRIGASNAMRSGVAVLPPPRRQTRISNCSNPAMPTVAAIASAAKDASCRQNEQRDHHRDQRDVEQQRRERRQRKAALRVQQRHHHRGRPGEGQIRQHQAGIVDGELQRLVPGKSRRQRRHDQRHQQAEQRGRHQQCRADGAEHAAGECRGSNGAIGLAHAQPGRHQGGVQRALGQQPPDDIDQLKRHQERIGHRAGAEQRRDHGIAREAEQPRGQRSRGYREEGADHEGFYSSTVACWRGADRDRPLHLFMPVWTGFSPQSPCRNRTDR